MTKRIQRITVPGRIPLVGKNTTGMNAKKTEKTPKSQEAGGIHTYPIYQKVGATKSRSAHKRRIGYSRPNNTTATRPASIEYSRVVRAERSLILPATVMISLLMT